MHWIPSLHKRQKKSLYISLSPFNRGGAHISLSQFPHSLSAHTKNPTAAALTHNFSHPTHSLSRDFFTLIHSKTLAVADSTTNISHPPPSNLHLHSTCKSKNSPSHTHLHHWRTRLHHHRHYHNLHRLNNISGVRTSPHHNRPTKTLTTQYLQLKSVL